MKQLRFFFFLYHVKPVPTTKLKWKPFQWKSIIIISNNPKNKLKIKTHIQYDKIIFKNNNNNNNILHKKKFISFSKPPSIFQI